MLVVGLGLSFAACSVEEPTEFTDENRSGFMAACNLPFEDPQLVTAVCGCAFARTEEELSFGRFAAIEEQLKEDPEQQLPAEISEIIAECFIAEAEL